MRAVVFVSVLVASGLALAVGGPFVLGPEYHDFADRRSLWGVPNAADVLSNLAFLAAGLWGGMATKARRDGAVVAWRVMSLGVCAVSFGSAYYHLRPDDASLVWDRLPMTVGFMGLFVALVCEHAVSLRRQVPLLLVALCAGASSVAFWRVTGDLRPYIWAQFGPLLCVPIVLALYPAGFTHRVYMVWSLLAYAGAKAAEAADRPIFMATGGWVSGHTVKHLLAASACGLLASMLWRRTMLAQRQPTGGAACGSPPAPTTGSGCR